MIDFRKSVITTIVLAAWCTMSNAIEAITTNTVPTSENQVVTNSETPSEAEALEEMPFTHEVYDTVLTYIMANRQLLRNNDTTLFAGEKAQRFNSFIQLTIDRYWMQANPYVYSKVAVRAEHVPLYQPKSAENYFSQSYGLNQRLHIGTSIKAVSPYQLYLNSVSHISQHHPRALATHWNLLPDAPELLANQQTFSAKDIRGMFRPEQAISLKKPEKLKALKIEKNRWYTRRNASVFMNQTAVTYWDKGGQNSISFLAVYNHESNYETQNFLWENDFEYKLGFQKQEAEDLVKNEDNFRASSKIGYKAYEFWNISGNIDLQTQLFDTYDIKKSKTQPVASFFTPAKIISSLGMDYKYKQVLSVFVSPFTYKLTFAALDKNIDLTKMGITDGRSYQELGGYVKTQLKWQFNTQGIVTSKLYLFSNYINNPQNVDFDWETIIDYKITYLLSGRFAWNMKYDDDIKLVIDKDANNKPIYGKKLQFKELFSLGFSYRF